MVVRAYDGSHGWRRRAGSPAWASAPGLQSSSSAQRSEKNFCTHYAHGRLTTGHEIAGRRHLYLRNGSSLCCEGCGANDYKVD